MTSNCSLQDGNKKYDLSQLKNLEENYEVSFDKDAEIILNVCHSVIPGYRVRCLPYSGACMVNKSAEFILSREYKDMIV